VSDAATVLVADDDPDVLNLVATLLERAGHHVARAKDGSEAIKAVYGRRPDAVVLDISMPGLDGWQVLERIREVSEVPVLMLTAESDELDKVRGLRSGADDFVTKPFGRQELLARVEALLRRSRGRAGADREVDVSEHGALRVDHQQRLATVAGEELKLTPLEFRLLAAFARNPRQVLSGDQIVDLVWDDPFTAQDQVKLLVGRLRKKLGGPEAGEIETVRGFGYRFTPPAGA
jgi:DNA-binding response OmpR family regulator